MPVCAACTKERTITVRCASCGREHCMKHFQGHECAHKQLVDFKDLPTPLATGAFTKVSKI